MLDLKVTILGFGYHVTCQHVPELAGMRWNRIDQHLIRYYQNILQTTRVLLGTYIKHFPLHVNSRSDRKRAILNKILRYFRDTYFAWNIEQLRVLMPLRANGGFIRPTLTNYIQRIINWSPEFETPSGQPFFWVLGRQRSDRHGTSSIYRLSLVHLA